MIGINWIPSNLAIENAVLLPFKFFYVDEKFVIILLLGVAFSFPWCKKLSFSINKNVLEVAKVISLLFIFAVCLSCLAANTYNPFIYFRF